MKSTGNKLTAVLAGGVLLASAAYGIGTQSGGGGASAASGSSSSDTQRDRGMTSGARQDRRGAFGPTALARKLGVSEDKLSAALEEIRAEMKPPGDRGAGRVADLAKALGVSEDKVTKALEKIHPGMGSRDRGAPRRFAAALAKELNIEASKVRSVFRSLRRDRDERPSLAEIAKKLDVTEADLTAALEKVRPKRHEGRRGRRSPARFAASLAKELDLDLDDVKAALKKLRTQHEAEHKARRTALAKALAKKLDLPLDKVLAALPARGPGGPGGHHGRGGPHGPGGPPPAFRGQGGPPGGPGRPGSFSPDGPPPGPGGGGLRF